MRGCEVDYEFTKKGVFYNVPDHDKIKSNLGDENSNTMLNAFGFEYI